MEYQGFGVLDETVYCHLSTNVTAISVITILYSVAAGRVGSAFAAELGTMAVSEQTDSLRVLGSDPVNYLISPRILACMVATPILNLLCFCMGEEPPFLSIAN